MSCWHMALHFPLNHTHLILGWLTGQPWFSTICLRHFFLTNNMCVMFQSLMSCWEKNTDSLYIKFTYFNQEAPINHYILITVIMVGCTAAASFCCCCCCCFCLLLLLLLPPPAAASCCCCCCRLLLLLPPAAAASSCCCCCFHLLLPPAASACCFRLLLHLARRRRRQDGARRNRHNRRRRRSTDKTCHAFRPQWNEVFFQFVIPGWIWQQTSWELSTTLMHIAPAIDLWFGCGKQGAPISLYHPRS